MKTLIKHAPKKRDYPILLNNYLVYGNEAYTTTIDTEIRCMVQKDDGIYSTINGMKTDFVIGDYPRMNKIQEKEFSIVITLGALETLAPAMSEEETRYYLCGIAFNCALGELAATDGHMAIVHKLPNCSAKTHPNFSVPIISSEFIKLVIAACKEEKVKELTIDFHPYHTRVEVGQYTICGKLVDGNFPDYIRVIPKDNTGITRHDQKQMRGILKSAKANAKALKIKTPAIKFIGEECIQVIDVHTFKFDSVTKIPNLGFNAEFLADCISGTVYFNETEQHCPIKILSDCEQFVSVVMSMRI